MIGIPYAFLFNTEVREYTIWLLLIKSFRVVALKREIPLGSRFIQLRDCIDFFFGVVVGGGGFKYQIGMLWV